jgi:hypothetical protein
MYPPRSESKGAANMLSWKLTRVIRRQNGFVIAAEKGSRRARVFIEHRRIDETIQRWHRRLEALFESCGYDTACDDRIGPGN